MTEGDWFPFLDRECRGLHASTAHTSKTLGGAGRNDGASPQPVGCSDLISRADVAMRRLRLGGDDVAACVGKAVYAQNEEDLVPRQTMALARLFWPLVCTTNYDEVFLQAKLTCSTLPRILGRNHDDCHRVLQHFSFRWARSYGRCKAS